MVTSMRWKTLEALHHNSLCALSVIHIAQNVPERLYRHAKNVRTASSCREPLVSITALTTNSPIWSTSSAHHALLNALNAPLLRIQPAPSAILELSIQIKWPWNCKVVVVNSNAMRVSTQILKTFANLATSLAAHVPPQEIPHVVLALQDTILSGWVSLANSIATMESMETPSQICVFCAIIRAWLVEVRVPISARSVPKVSCVENHFVSPNAKRESSSWMVHASLVIKSVWRVSVLKIINATRVQIIR